MGPSMSWDPWPRPVARAVVGMQECTQIGKNGLSVPFWGIRVHCCAVADRRGDAGVYTGRRKWTLDAVLGHSCTLLRRDSPRRQPTLTPEEPYDISLFIGANTLDVSLIACCSGSTMLYATVGSATHNAVTAGGLGPSVDSTDLNMAHDRVAVRRIVFARVWRHRGGRRDGDGIGQRLPRGYRALERHGEGGYH